MILFKVGHPVDVIAAHLSEIDRNTLKEIAESESTTPGDVAIEMMSWMLSALRGDTPDSRPLIILNQQDFSQKEANHG